MILIKHNFALWLLTLTLVGGMAAVQASDTSQAAIKKIEINEASIEMLKELNGIGPKRARAIVEYRQVHGPFKSLDDLKQIHGIGNKIVDTNRHKMFIRPPEPENPPEANNSPATTQPVAVEPATTEPAAAEPATDQSEKSGEVEASVNEDSEKEATSSPSTDEYPEDQSPD